MKTNRHVIDITFLAPLSFFLLGTIGILIILGLSRVLMHFDWYPPFVAYLLVFLTFATGLATSFWILYPVELAFVTFIIGVLAWVVRKELLIWLAKPVLAITGLILVGIGWFSAIPHPKHHIVSGIGALLILLGVFGERILWKIKEANARRKFKKSMKKK